MRDDEKAALAAQVREIEAFLTTIPEDDPRTISDVNLVVELSLGAALRNLQGMKRKRGRPDIFESSNPVTIDSYRAFRFVQREMQYFRKCVGRVRVPADARETFLKYAEILYPDLDHVIVAEHMRRIRTAPIEEEFRTENWRTINYERDRNS